jgi:hypothetical protein
MSKGRQCNKAFTANYKSTTLVGITAAVGPLNVLLLWRDTIDVPSKCTIVGVTV